MSFSQWPLGQIATQIPGAIEVLFKHKINFCLLAQKTLKEIAQEAKLNDTDICEELQKLSVQEHESINYDTLTNPELIDHILIRYHQVHRAQLSELIELAQRVELVHIEESLCPTGLARHLYQMKVDLEQHMMKEENILFPILCNEFAPTVQGPISVMMEEHVDHMQDIETIYEMTNNLTIHEDACGSWKALYADLKKFITDINMHIYIENEILFKRTA
jgi:regulator of cell morphogenesis and NO signaling